MNASSCYPDVPGVKGEGPTRVTSQAAADKIAPKAKTVRDQVLEIFRQRPDATADEIAMVLGRPELFIRPRVSELGRMGLVEATGSRRRNRLSDHSAVVWRLAPPLPNEGRAA